MSRVVVASNPLRANSSCATSMMRFRVAVLVSAVTRMRGPRMRVTAETKTATRKRIMEVAQELFARNGFDATTTRDIARAADIAVGTLFNYFATKEAIVESLISEAYARVAERFDFVSPPEMMLEEELFPHVAAVLRKLNPIRKYVPALLETAPSSTAE